MKVVGHGVDLVELRRVEAMIDRHGERFLDRVFTVGERAYADRGRRRRVERYAARFAGKEAVLKALGTGWSAGVGWSEVEFVREPTGRPGVRLHGRAASIARSMGIEAWAVSLSHTATHALASAIATGAAKDRPTNDGT